MFSSNKNIENLQELFMLFKRYVELQKRFVQLEFVSKMTILFSAFILGIILFMLGTIAILFILLALASILSEAFRSPIAGYGIITALLLLSIGFVYSMRKKLIIDPLTRFLANLFLHK